MEPNQKIALEATSPLKYNIKTRLAALTERDRSLIHKRVRKAHGVAKSSISRYLNIRMSDSSDIPAGVLNTFAMCLNVQMEDLFNDEQ